MGDSEIGIVWREASAVCDLKDQIGAAVQSYC